MSANDNGLDQSDSQPHNEGTHSLYATLCSGDKTCMRFLLQKQ
jgi:hypothetical protein